ncbi:MAG: hypothetical protein ABR981_01915 [Candidatus Micrarchaeaceae archaeon]|jgi:CRISPR/Cas system-associated exonuclease Cas4 (RecB family)
MGSTNKCERELERCIDAMVDEANKAYSAELNENAEIDARMRDIDLRDKLVQQIKEEIIYKKISERMMHEQMKSIVYEINVRISSENLSSALVRKYE